MLPDATFLAMLITIGYSGYQLVPAMALPPRHSGENAWPLNTRTLPEIASDPTFSAVEDIAALIGQRIEPVAGPSYAAATRAHPSHSMPVIVAGSSAGLSFRCDGMPVHPKLESVPEMDWEAAASAARLRGILAPCLPKNGELACWRAARQLREQ
jgi:hypothetical protein